MVTGEYFNKEELAVYLGMSKRTVNSFMSDPVNPLPHYRFGPKLLRFKKTEVDEWAKKFAMVDDEVDRIVEEVMESCRMKTKKK